MTSPDRSFRLYLGLLLAGALLVLWGGSLAWITSTMPDSLSVVSLHLRRSGAELRPLMRAMGFVALAGVAAVVALRGRARRVVGMLIGLVSGPLIALTALDGLRYRRHPGPGDLAVGPCGTGSVRCTIELHRGLAGPTLVFLGAGLLVAAGVVAAMWGREWSGLGASYEAPGGAPEPPVTEKAVWDALDRGDDPTA